jgi:chemotaxis protein methyltransferase CheR
MLSPDPEPDERSYAFLADLVYRRSRIRLGPDKRAFVAGRLSGRLRSLGLRSYDDYCRRLEATGGETEAERLVELISTNHTHFFREPAHFAFLAERLLPAVTRRTPAEGRPVRVWCAAAASGEEAYSLALVLAEHERSTPFRWTLDVSDISPRMLERCRSGIYEAGRVQLPDPDWLARYFRQGFGEREGLYRVKPWLRERLQVQTVNLFQPSYPVAAGQDVIFCRNVMIYFDAESRQTLVERLYEQLAPGGHLFVGHAESLLGLRHRFRQVRPAVYEKPS